jgi:hypothetical protein
VINSVALGDVEGHNFPADEWKRSCPNHSAIRFDMIFRKMMIGNRLLWIAS